MLDPSPIAFNGELLVICISGRFTGQPGRHVGGLRLIDQSSPCRSCWNTGLRTGPPGAWPRMSTERFGP